MEIVETPLPPLRQRVRSRRLATYKTISNQTLIIIRRFIRVFTLCVAPHRPQHRPRHLAVQATHTLIFHPPVDKTVSPPTLFFFPSFFLRATTPLPLSDRTQGQRWPQTSHPQRSAWRMPTKKSPRCPVLKSDRIRSVTTQRCRPANHLCHQATTLSPRCTKGRGVRTGTRLTAAVAAASNTDESHNQLVSRSRRRL